MNSTSRSFARRGENPAGRHLRWEGCFNARDLGGIPVAGGGETRWGAVVRADCIDGLSAAGWSALEAHGVRTVIDLRNDDERALDASRRPDGIATLHLPLDAIEDSGFWDDWMHGPQFATPLYFDAHLELFPERSARVLAAVARAEPGGVLIHCVSGRDRTGQISMLLLALAGVAPEDVAADYMLSSARLESRYESLGEPNQGPELEEFLRSRGTSAGELIVSTLASVDLEATLRQGGLTSADVGALRERLTG
jgi:protein tyrosine/serine phosphatase